jgi:hypothetical protein
MPSFEQHCAESVALCGKPNEEVHRWLDEFAGRPPYGMRHRKKRHSARQRNGNPHLLPKNCKAE